MSTKPKVEAELDILEQLENDAVTNQLSLSKRISVSVGFVNALLKRAIQKGFVKVSSAPRKRYAYYVTPQGFQEKSRLVAEYLETSLQFFRRARSEYNELFEGAASSAGEKYVFVGGGELTEIALLAANETESLVIGVFDPTAHSERILGIPVVRDLKQIDPDATLVITESSQPQALYDELRSIYGNDRILAPRFLRVTEKALMRHQSSEAAE